MSKLGVVVFCACALALPAAAQAPNAPPSSVTPEQAIAVRQASLDMSAIVFGALKAVAADGREPKTQAYTALGLAKWARAYPGLFPVGSGPGETSLKTQARPEIWTDREGFLKAAGNYAAAAEKLSALASANDAAGFKTQLFAVQAACDACHAKYKLGDQRGPR